MRLMVLGRSYCHLCDEMVAEIRRFAAERGAALTVDVVDVDADPALEERFGERVPVLVAGESEICHFRLDRGALAAHLAKDG
jgi:thioredoxin reductase (NADPH)